MSFRLSGEGFLEAKNAKVLFDVMILSGMLVGEVRPGSTI